MVSCLKNQWENESLEQEVKSYTMLLFFSELHVKCRATRVKRNPGDLTEVWPCHSLIQLFASL